MLNPTMIRRTGPAFQDFVRLLGADRRSCADISWRIHCRKGRGAPKHRHEQEREARRHEGNLRSDARPGDSADGTSESQEGQWAATVPGANITAPGGQNGMTRTRRIARGRGKIGAGVQACLTAGDPKETGECKT